MIYEELRTTKNIQFSKPIIFYLVVPQGERPMYIDFGHELEKPYYQQNPERVTFWDAVYPGNKLDTPYVMAKAAIFGIPLRATMCEDEDSLRCLYNRYERLWLGIEEIEEPNYVALRKTLKEIKKNQGIAISLHKSFKKAYFALHIDDKWDLQENGALLRHEYKFPLNSLSEYSIYIDDPFISAPLLVKRFEKDEQIPQLEEFVRSFHKLLGKKNNK